MSTPPASLWFDQALLPDGWARGVRLTLRDGLIASVEAGADRPAHEPDMGVALPGICNIHSHAFQRAMAGLTEARGGPAESTGATDDFWSWRRLMYRFLDRGGPEDIQAITAFAFMEMLEGGFTRVAEFHYLHNDPQGHPYADRGELTARIVDAAAATGIGLTLLPVFYAHSTFGGAEPTQGQRRFVTDLDGFGELMTRAEALVAGLDDAVVGVAPHSLRAVTPDELAAVARLGRGPIHIHISEQTREVEDCLAWSGARPVQWLLDHAEVGAKWCLIHATHVEPQEWAEVVRRGAVAGLCPVTEANLGDGVFPAAAYVEAGGRFGIGTDSNVQIGVAEELRMLEYSQRLALRRRAVMATSGLSTGRALFEGALSGGAQACGFGSGGGVGSGGLAVGAPADILALDPDRIAFAGRKGDAVLDSWIFGGDRAALRSVWRRGRHVVVDGRHIDRGRIEAGFRSALSRVLDA